MSRPERHVDDITDMRRSCRLRENTSARRPLGSSSRLLKVPNVFTRPFTFVQIIQYIMEHILFVVEGTRTLTFFNLDTFYTQVVNR